MKSWTTGPNCALMALFAATVLAGGCEGDGAGAQGDASPSAGGDQEVCAPSEESSNCSPAD